MSISNDISRIKRASTVDELVPHLVSVIRELESEVEKLKQELRSLRNRMQGV